MLIRWPTLTTMQIFSRQTFLAEAKISYLPEGVIMTQKNFMERVDMLFMVRYWRGLRIFTQHSNKYTE